MTGNIATTEIPSLGGEVCISTDANHTVDNVMANIRINHMGHENEAVAGQWTMVAGHVYEDESVANDIPCFDPEGQSVETTVIEGTIDVGGVTNILATGSETAPQVKWQARAYKLPPVNEDGFGGAEIHLCCGCFYSSYDQLSVQHATSNSALGGCC